MSKILTPKSFTADIPRASHNLYQEKSTTLHPMTLIPIFYRRMFKGDKFDFGVMESILRSEPTFAPLLSNWRLRFEWYFDSDANRYGWVDNNTRLTSEEVMNRRHHTYITGCSHSVGDELTSFNTVGRGSIADYAGIAPGYSFVIIEDDEFPQYNQAIGDFGSEFNIDFHLTYLNIIRNYHVNKQFPSVPYIRNKDSDTEPDSARLLYGSLSLEALDDIFMLMRACRNGVCFDVCNSSDNVPSDLESYYSYANLSLMEYLRATERPFGGLFVSQYEPDLYQNLLAKDNNLLRATVSTAGDGFTVETFRLANHLQGLYDKIFVSGGTDRDLSRAIWGVKSNRDYDIPELICVHDEIIGNNLVVSNASGQSDYNGESVSSTPGGMSGFTNTRRNSKRYQRFEAKTAGSLMCVVSLVPIVSYSQNIERHLLENNFMDEFTPDMARKGFEKIPLSDYCALPNVSSDNVSYGNNPLSTVVGTQIAWLREMTAVNRVHGEFSNGGEKRDWHLLRDYQFVSLSGDREYNISPYGDPLAFQYPFVSQTISDPNFHLQLSIKCDAYRPVPRRFMPNLGN